MKKTLVLSLAVLSLVACHSHYRPRPVVRRVEERLPIVTIPQVVAMLQQGAPQDQVVGQLRNAVVAPACEQWSADDIVALKNAGASDVLIFEMQEASHRNPVRVTEYRD